MFSPFDAKCVSFKLSIMIDIKPDVAEELLKGVLFALAPISVLRLLPDIGKNRSF